MVSGLIGDRLGEFGDQLRVYWEEKRMEEDANGEVRSSLFFLVSFEVKI